MDANSNESTEIIEEGEDDGLGIIDGSAIGTFTAGGDGSSDREERNGKSNRYWVHVCAHESGIPHFHVFDKAGEWRSQTRRTGVHACVRIQENEYCGHDACTDRLGKVVREALDKFLREVRPKEKYSSDVGMTNFFHAIAEWNDNNAAIGSPNWVDPGREQPDYGTIGDRLDRAGRGLPDGAAR